MFHNFQEKYIDVLIEEDSEQPDDEDNKKSEAIKFLKKCLRYILLDKDIKINEIFGVFMER